MRSPIAFSCAAASSTAASRRGSAAAPQGAGQGPRNGPRAWPRRRAPGAWKGLWGRGNTGGGPGEGPRRACWGLGPSGGPGPRGALIALFLGPCRLVTNKPKAQLPAEKFSSHFSGPEATADLGGHPPAMCDDMGRSLRVEPLHSVLARAPNQRSGTWPYAPPATSLWAKQVTAIQPEPIPPKDDQQGLRPSSLCHISCCAYDLRTTHKAI